jgi:hypothetical protein
VSRCWRFPGLIDLTMLNGPLMLFIEGFAQLHQLIPSVRETWSHKRIVCVLMRSRTGIRQKFQPLSRRLLCRTGSLFNLQRLQLSTSPLRMGVVVSGTRASATRLHDSKVSILSQSSCNPFFRAHAWSLSFAYSLYLLFSSAYFSFVSFSAAHMHRY